MLLGIAQRDLAQLAFRRGHVQEARDLAKHARGILNRLGARVEVETLDLLLSQPAGPARVS